MSELNTAAREVTATTRKVIALQIGVGILVAAVFFMGKGTGEALAALYGSAVSVVIAFLLGRGVARAADAAQQSRSKSMWILYFGAALRFVLVLALFAAGLAALKLDPLATVIGFVAAQMAYILIMRGSGGAMST